MGLEYLLYSKTRKVLYVNDKDHDRFWSKYLRNKYPRDTWVITQSNVIGGIELMHSLRAIPYTRVNLISLTDTKSKKISHEIYDMMERIAIDGIDQKTYIVYYVNRDETVIVYCGDNLMEAEKALSNTRKCDGIEVWVNGRYTNVLYESECKRITV